MTQAQVVEKGGQKEDSGGIHQINDQLPALGGNKVSQEVRAEIEGIPRRN